MNINRLHEVRKQSAAYCACNLALNVAYRLVNHHEFLCLCLISSSMRVNFTSSIINKEHTLSFEALSSTLKTYTFLAVHRNLMYRTLKNTETKATKTNFVTDKIKELYQKASIINRQTFWREGFKLPSEMLFFFFFCNILSQI